MWQPTLRIRNPRPNRIPTRTRYGPSICAVAVLAGALLVSACDTPPPSQDVASQWQFIDVPAAPGSLAAELTVADDGPVLSWLEPLSTESGAGHRLRAAAWDEGSWGPPRTLIESEIMFANWADRPQLQAVPGSGWVAAWLDKLGDDTYAYGLQLATGGASLQGPWLRRGLLHDDASASEHGFVTWLPGPEGVHAFWLDGRRMPEGGDMQLRTTLLPASTWSQDATPLPSPPSSTLLDDRVCECCATDSAMGADGPLVVYRDRSAEEVRDIAIVRWQGSGWSEPRAIHRDGWRITGCPVNGPVVAAVGQRVVVAWFTVVDGASRINLAWSDDAGATFGPPFVVDADKPLGRLDLAMQGTDIAWLSWLATGTQGAEVRVQRFHADGKESPSQAVAQVSAQRSAGVPRLVSDDAHLFLVWRQDGELAGLRSARLGWDKSE